MVSTSYAYTKEKKHTAKAYGRDLPISTKAAINVCKALRGKTVEKAVAYLTDVEKAKRAIPYTRFTDGVGHRRGAMASGRFPKKAALEIRSIIESAAANAANLGLAQDLEIVHICAHKAASPLHFGRQRRRAMKRTHIEVVVKEQEGAKKSVSKKTTKKTSSISKQSPTKNNEASLKASEKVADDKKEKKPQEPVSKQSTDGEVKK